MLKKLAATIAFASLMAGVAYAGSTAATGVVGSMHDINVAGTGSYTHDTYQRVCVFCHTPHNALANGATPKPLWNHAESTVNIPAYTWSSPANSAIAMNVLDPLVGPSRLCMACHDGLTAVDSHGSAGSQVGSTALNSTTRTITDLTVTHPIGFKYADAMTARGATELVPDTTGFLTSAVTAAFDTNTRAGATYTTKTIGDTMYNGYMTCASCHDVHNTVNAVGTGYNYFIYAKEEGSAICLSCHVK